MRRALLSAAIALSLTGGAALQADGTRATEGLLTDTPEKAAHLAELTQGKIVRRDQDGRASYFYADGSVCHCLYAGTHQQYQEYRRLARQQTMADEDAIVSDEASNPTRWSIWGL